MPSEDEKEFLKHDLEEQKEEMDKFKWIESEKEGHDVGKEAYLEWIKQFAAGWREQHPFPKK